MSPTPYVISERAVEKAWVPPKGISCLPWKVRSKVPQAYQYWHAQEPAKRRAIRDELLQQLRERAITSIRASIEDMQRMPRELRELDDVLDQVQFKLLKQTWKGQKVIREGPSRTLFWVVLKCANQYTAYGLDSNPIHNSRVACLPFIQKGTIALWKTVGEVPPRSLLNTTKNTPSTISVLDQGRVTVRDGFSSTHLELRLKGAKLHGVWVAAKQKGSKLWTFVRIDGTQ